MEKLTGKQARFVDEYIVCLNGTEAHRRAGYAGDDNVHAVEASRLLRNPKIIRAIADRTAYYAMSANEVLAQLTDISRNDIGDVLNGFGGIDISEAMRRGKTNQIKRFKSKVTTITEKDGTEKEIIETEVELYDRQAALNTLAKYHDLTNKVIVEDWRTEIIALLKDGKAQPEEVQEEFGIDIAQELFIAAGLLTSQSGAE